jgi:glycosyltransferase involved in cell wall biosynthesis
MPIKINSNNSAPKLRLTVITVVYNAKETIEQTILSVVTQAAEGIEYLIIDGASNDGTVEIIHRLSHHIDHWVSEPDHGIYEAMNKGVAMARGEWIMFLNADDYFESARSVRWLLDATDDAFDIVAGRTLIKSTNQERLFCPSPRFGLMLQLPFMHPSAIVRRRAFDKCGYFDTRYRLAADCDFILRMFERGHKYRYISEVVSVMRVGGASERGFIRGRIEYMLAYQRNMRDPIGAGLGFAVSMTMYFITKLIRIRARVQFLYKKMLNI